MNKKDTFPRRAFTVTAGAALFSAITSRKGFSAPATEENLKIDAGAEIGVIRPELHGHFAEHLGSCTYGGLWVGRNSRIPNVNGYRKQAVDYLKAWLDVALRGRPPTAKPSCANPVEKNLELGRSIGVNSTPTLVLASGERVTGALSREHLTELLEAKR